MMIIGVLIGVVIGTLIGFFNPALKKLGERLAKIDQKMQEIKSDDYLRREEIPAAVDSIVTKKQQDWGEAQAKEWQRQFDGLQKAQQLLQTDSRDLNQKLTTLQEEQRKLKAEQQRQTGNRDLNRELTSLQEEQQKLKAEQQRLIGKLDELKHELDNQRVQPPPTKTPAVDDVAQGQIAELRRLFDAQNSSLLAVEQRALTACQQAKQEWQAQFAELERRLEQIKAQNVKHMPEHKTLAPPPPPPPLPPPPIPHKPPVIKSFFINEPSRPFFTNDMAQIKQRITAAADLQDLLTFVEKAPLPPERKASLLRVLKKHQTGILTMAQNWNPAAYAPGILSEKATEKYFSVFRGSLLGNFVVTLYRALKSNTEEMKVQRKIYQEMLAIANAYLSRAGIYTLKVLPQRLADDDNFEDLTPATVTTTDPQKHNFIEEIERLPYRIKYLNEDGEVSFYQFPGKMTVAVYEEGEA